jgi:hypothetical protein
VTPGVGLLHSRTNFKIFLIFAMSKIWQLLLQHPETGILLSEGDYLLIRRSRWVVCIEFCAPFN